MAGHSKWANIQHRKGRQDAARSKLFSKLSKEITVAAKMGDPDPDKNPRLRLAVKEAKSQSVPKDVIDRAIKKSQANEGDDYEEIRYEGYAPGGVAVMVDCMTDNPTRTVAEVRHAFSKHGGSLGTSGSVAYLFSEQGQLLIETAADAALEERILEAALEAGAEDVISEDGYTEGVTAPADFASVKAALDALTLTYVEASVGQRAAPQVAVAGEDAETVSKLLERLEALDDVQEVYSNAEL